MRKGGKGHFAYWTLLAVAIGGCGGLPPQLDLFGIRAPQRNSSETLRRALIVVDIDETLCDTDYFDLILRTGREKSEPLRGAKNTLARLSRDFDLIYLTSRPTYLLGDTKTWLADNGFPASPVYTADRIAELVSVRAYKTRYLSELLERHPNACIGIGDRGSDAEAYRANGMISVIVNPNEHSDFNSRDVVLRSWQDVDAFFQANSELLKDFHKVRETVRAGQARFHTPSQVRLVRYDDADDGHGRGKLNRILLKLFPSLQRHARDQAAAAEAVADKRSLAEAVALATNHWPRARLLSVSLSSSGDQPIVDLKLIQNQQLISARLDAAQGQVLSENREAIPSEASRVTAAASGGRISFSEAIQIAGDRTDGQAYDVKLRMEYRRPVYEVSLLSRKGFWEVDVDAASGLIQEIDHEWRLIPLN